MQYSCTICSLWASQSSAEEGYRGLARVTVPEWPADGGGISIPIGEIQDVVGAREMDAS